MKTYALKFDINKPIIACDIQNTANQVFFRLRKISRNVNIVVLALAVVLAIFGGMVFIYSMLHLHVPTILTLLVIALTVFGTFAMAALENLKKRLREAFDLMLPAHTLLAAEHLDGFMQDEQCRRYTQNVAEQHRQLLLLEVYGMQKYLRQKEASDRMAEARKKLEAVGLTGPLSR